MLESNTYWVYRDGVPFHRTSSYDAAVNKFNQLMRLYPESKLMIKQTTYVERITHEYAGKAVYAPKERYDA
jgi:hypothetical protein